MRPEFSMVIKKLRWLGGAFVSKHLDILIKINGRLKDGGFYDGCHLSTKKIESSSKSVFLQK